MLFQGFCGNPRGPGSPRRIATGTEPTLFTENEIKISLKACHVRRPGLQILDSAASRPAPVTVQPPSPAGQFPETLWEQISAVRGGRDQASLERLATAYWKPLYFFLRRSGDSHENASDHVQGFFLHVFSTEFFAHVERDGAKFRSYLLASLRNWQARHHARETAQKRGGGVIHLPLDELESLEHAPDMEEGGSAELHYDRRWARDLIARAIIALRTDYTARGEGSTFAAIQGALPGSTGLPPYTDLAATLGGTEAAARKAVFNLRQRFGECVRREIRATVQNPSDAEEEFEHLFRVLSAP